MPMLKKHWHIKLNIARYYSSRKESIVAVNQFINQIQMAAQNLSSKEQMLGKGLNIPNNATSSGARKILNSIQQSHALVLSKGDVPYLATGYENRFGELSSSRFTFPANATIIAQIPKFSYIPNHDYYLIVLIPSTNELHCIERKPYKYITESYGYLNDNSRLDRFVAQGPGTVIPAGQLLMSSTGFDEYDNKTNGRNINVVYMALDNNMEDSVVISEDCSYKLAAPLIDKVEIIINENDIPLNLYGDENTYKVCPNIGEQIIDGILLACRQSKKEESIYTQSVSRLRELMMSDNKYTVKGKIIDIDVYCNNLDYNENNIYTQQFYQYYKDRLRMDNDIINAVGPYLAQGYSLSYDLSALYNRAKNELDGKKFIDKNKFSNLKIDFYVVEERKLEIGDKVVDRYGGKGVVSKIVPTRLMPRMSNGLVIDMIKNSSTMYNRENAGQIFELELNYISMKILDRIRSEGLSSELALQHILKFLELQSPTEYQEMKKYTDTLAGEDGGLDAFVDSILENVSIPVSNRPITETMDIEQLRILYQAFPWIDKEPLMVPILDSNGNPRFVPTRMKTVAGPQYYLRLKQFSEEKFSAVSMSYTNIKGENAKSKAHKNHREPNANTPIKFGQMETGDLSHIGSEYVALNLLLHSLSPHGRRLVEQIAVGDPYNVDVKINSFSKNRSAEILNARLKTMGYKLVFRKIVKENTSPVLVPVLEFLDKNPNEMVNVVEIMPEGYDFDHWYQTIDKIAEIEKQSPIMIYPITFI